MPLYKVTTEWTGYTGTPYYSTHYFNAGVETDVSTLIDAVGEFWGDFASHITNPLKPRVQSDVYTIDPASGEVLAVETAPGASPTMTGTGDLLPLANQGLLQLRTGVYAGGREIRGRLFIPGALEADSASGVPSSAYMSALGVAAGTLLSTLPSWAVYSKKQGQAASIQEAVVWGEWAVLRSRRT